MANQLARALRRNRTSAERTLWWHLRTLKGRGFKFRQQAPIDCFIVDFVCLAERLIVEVDGATHATEKERAADARREAHLTAQAFRVLRVWNGDVYDNIEGVMDLIVHHLEMGHPRSPPPPPPPRKGEGSSRPPRHSKRRARHASMSNSRSETD